MRVKIEPIESWVNVTVSELLSPAARSKAVADFARGRLMEAKATNHRVVGAETPHEQFVDGRRGAALESVHPDRGRIVFEFELINDVLLWIMTTLIERSPRGPAGGAGTYREAHTLFADGAAVAPRSALPEADEYSIANPLPYSRRLEIGRTASGRDFLVSVPNRIYERTAADAKARFGNVAKVGFTYRGIVGGYAVNQAKAGSTGQPWWLGGAAARPATGVLESMVAKRFGRTTHNASKLRFPTITVRAN
ncbi:MAG: hypothetical protein AB7I42_24880 [Bradyrhizobium sp.]|uniref:hypothetical protein n=1 Tax=Bradyrhizobium sp. TaxID=376 RepID=UPI003D096881